VKKLAWLNATPDGAKMSRRESYEKASGPDSLFLRLPELDGAQYIVQMLFEAGTLMHAGMGPTPLTWQEIDAWLRVTGTQAELWERLLIKELSHAYVNMLHDATKKDCPDPYVYVEEAEQIDRTAVANKLRNAFANLRRAPNTE
jgi:hypothetical protein